MNKGRLTVLVLGVGGNVSQGILKALALTTLPCRVLGACVSPLAAGLFMVEEAFVSPFASSPSFPDWLIGICKAEGVDAVLSGVEPVLRVLAAEQQRLREATNAIAVVSPMACLDIGDSKLATCEWLQAQGLNFPRYASAGDQSRLDRLVSECGFPLIAKPVRGKGAHGVMEIRTSAGLDVVRHRSDYVVQEYLGDQSEEYTVGCFSDSAGQVRGSIAMRRELLEGTTYRAEAGEFPDASAEAVRIARALRPRGPCNVQLRMSEGRAVCFEINVRFSGTTPIRARLGFNEVEAVLRHYVLGEPAVELPRVTKGVAVRYWNELYPDAASVSELRTTGSLTGAAGRALAENYGIRE